MKKKLIFVLLFLLLISFGYLYISGNINYLLEKYGLLKNIKINDNFSFIKNTSTGTENTQKSEEEALEDKVITLRNKIKVKGLIDSGNSFLENQYYLYALKDYLKALSQSPKDKSIVNKIAITYFSMKNFTRAYGYYKQISDYEKINKDDVMLSLLYSKEITKENKQYFFDEIDYFKLGEEKTFYYKTSINCLEDFHRCKQIFADYIAQKEKLGLKLESNEMLNIKEAFYNYDNFKVHDLTYKNALLIGVFLQNKLYPISIGLGKQLLLEKPDYKAIFQIIGKSYFELGKYKESKKYLADYLELDIENKDVIYLLGIINSELGEYVLSNIYLNSALEKGYVPSINLRRRMVYNLGEIGENEKMMKLFNELIEKEPKLERSDLYLYIYYSIVNNNLYEAELMSKKGLELFKDDSNFYGYLGWINKENSNIEEAEKFLLKGLELDQKNAMINLNLGLIEFDKKDYSKALIYFKKTISYDKTNDFSPLAEDGLKKIDEEMKKLEEEKSKN